MRVSELIKQKDINSWKNGDVITIKAGTGSGKSHFIKNSLYEHAKNNDEKILMLVHRKTTLTQFEYELKQYDNNDIVKTTTYQSVETVLKNSGSFNFNKWRYVVCDEFHYFMQDSSMNRYTDIGLNAILNLNKQVKIFMSATGGHMKRFIEEERGLNTTEYVLPNNSYRQIKQLVFFDKIDDYNFLIKRFKKKKEKTIFFIDNEMAHKLYKKHKTISLFNCSDTYKYVKDRCNEEIDKMLLNEKFDDYLFLFTTTVMDAGVNIIDESLKNIVVDVYDIGKLIQCIGRKRFKSNNDTLNVYIKNIPNKRLGGYKSMYSKKLTKADCLIWRGKDEYINKYGREPDENSVVYDVINADGEIEKRINELMYFKIKCDIDQINDVLKVGYKNYIAQIFNKGTYFEVDTESKQTKRKIPIEEYLKGVVGKKLYKTQQQKLIRIINLKDSKGRLQKGIKTINGYFEDNSMGYIIIKNIDRRRKLKNGKDNPHRDKTYWKIEENIE